MIFSKTPVAGAFLIDLEKRGDARGFFARVYCRKEFSDQGISFEIAQANTSYSAQKGTFRGFHFQRAPFEEAKLVRCTQGALYDIVVDIRPESPTYKRWFGVELTAENCRMLFLPKGTAHGFITLVDHTVALYLVDQFYAPQAESGIRYDDPAFSVVLPTTIEVISEKDANHPNFTE